jgi:hypothetical protein
LEPNKQAEEVEKDLSAGEETSVSSPEEKKATLEPEAEVEAQTATAEREEAETKGKEGPTRSEKRVQQLLGKLKAVGQQAGQGYGEPLRSQPGAVSPYGEAARFPWEQESDFVPGREYTVDELNQIVDSRVQSAIAQKDKVDQVRRSVEGYADEIEWLSREAPELKDPEFDEKLSRLIVEINSDERGGFLPKMSPKEIYENLKGFMSKARTEGEVEASARLHESGEQGAVAPGSGRVSSRDYEEETLYRRAMDTGSTEDWANLIKRRIFSKKS